MFKIIHISAYTLLIGLVVFLGYELKVRTPNLQTALSSGNQTELSFGTEYFVKKYITGTAMTNLTKVIIFPEDSSKPEIIFTDSGDVVPQRIFENTILTSTTTESKFFFQSDWNSGMPRLVVLDANTTKEFVVDPDCDVDCTPPKTHRLDYYYLDNCVTTTQTNCQSGYRKIFSIEKDFTAISSINYVPLSGSPVGVGVVSILENEVGAVCCDASAVIINKVIEYNPLTRTTRVRSLENYNNIVPPNK